MGHFLGYLVVFVIALYLANLSNRANIAITAAALTPYLAAMTFIISLSILGVAVFVVIAIVTALLKLKAFAIAKVILIGIGGLFAGVFTGGVGTAIAVIFVTALMFVAVKEAFLAIYGFISEKLIDLMLWTRERGDALRIQGDAGQVLAVFVEYPFATFIPVWGMWASLSWVDGVNPSGFDVTVKVILCAVYSVIAYRLFLLATSGPNRPDRGIDMPGPF